MGTVVGGYLLAKQVSAAASRIAAGEGDAQFLNAKIATARFYLEQILPPAVALLGPITTGAGMLYALDEDALVR